MPMSANWVSRANRSHECHSPLVKYSHAVSDRALIDRPSRAFRRYGKAVFSLSLVPVLLGCSVQFGTGAGAQRNVYRAQMRDQFAAYGKVNAASKNGTCASDVLSADCQTTVERFCEAADRFHDSVLAIDPPQEYITQHRDVVRVLVSLTETCASAEEGFNLGSTTQVSSALVRIGALHEDIGPPMIAIGAVSP